eukprot:scaffold303502_cov21-Prasinocladus_malaysianus.AAC.1
MIDKGKLQATSTYVGVTSDGRDTFMGSRWLRLRVNSNLIRKFSPRCRESISPGDPWELGHHLMDKNIA